ncbi:hypothetical protein J1605_012154 [Eschrichtius robustus]|uniref:Borealin C-terminal domain-containing protein n=1 Tax=Eschrichtius robustus TaxID=9764 RepID=A0AB34GJU3_ESCRO|nr:hypothetical protein J1605_012154 [Eschrichtius robustus]
MQVDDMIMEEEEEENKNKNLRTARNYLSHCEFCEIDLLMFGISFLFQSWYPSPLPFPFAGLFVTSVSFDCDFRLKGVLHPRREPGPYKEKAKVKGNRSSHCATVTPAVGRLELSMVKPTPGLTPRFDSRVFKTPGLRTPAARERIYNVSVNGSPLADSKEIFLTVPVGGGESMRLLASDLQRIDIAQLDPEALGSIKKLSVSLGFLSTHRRPPVAFWV